MVKIQRGKYYNISGRSYVNKDKVPKRSRRPNQGRDVRMCTFETSGRRPHMTHLGHWAWSKFEASFVPFLTRHTVAKCYASGIGQGVF